jgi:hypothetical protein
MGKDPKTAENQPVRESNFQMMKFRLLHSLMGGETLFFRSVFPQPAMRVRNSWWPTQGGSSA